MSRDRTIAVVGVSDEEAAHLRLLLRSSERDLDVRWRWSSGEAVDLLVVDAESFAGQMARTRAQAGGVRVATFSDQPPVDGQLVLRRPLLRANVVEVLNAITRAAVAGPAFSAQSDSFYTGDLRAMDAPARTPAHDAVAVEGLDALLRPQPAELRGEPVGNPPVPPRPPAASESPPRESRPAATPPVPTSRPPRSSNPADLEPRTLRDWLAPDALAVPVAVELAGLPPLALDPKHAMAYAPASLASLRPYCHARWTLRDWQPLTSGALVRLSATQQAHAWTRLTWLDVLEHSGGRLASHLDAGGTYRLRQWMEVDRELTSVFRVASCLLKPMRLHEVAAASGAPMGEVFDIVNAYSAIGLMECRPRQRADEPPPSLLQRLGKSLGKRP